MKLRRQKALDPLTPAERDKLAAALNGGETFAEARARIAKPRAEDGYDLRVSIKTLFTLHDRYTKYRLFTQDSPHPITFAEYLDLHGGEPQPHTILAQRHIQKMAYAIVTTEGSNLKPADLLQISRLLAFPLQQQAIEHKMEIAREKLDLEKSKQHLRQQQFHHRKSQKNPPSEKPFRIWTAEELAVNQPKVEAAFQADPYLRHVGLPPVDHDPAPPEIFHPQGIPENPPSENDTAPLSDNPQSAIRIPQSLEQRVNQYTIDRYHEALHGKNPDKVGCFVAHCFKSKMQWCPCGLNLPCPEHGDFPDRFWEVCSDASEYIECFENKNLPYTHPGHLIREREKREASNRPNSGIDADDP